MLIYLGELAAAFLLILLSPVAKSPALREAYRNTLALYLTKLRPPPLVIVGDSLAAGACGLGRIDTINLGVPGSFLRQVDIVQAAAFNPARIIVISGTNDLRTGQDWQAMEAEIARIYADPRAVAVIPPGFGGNAEDLCRFAVLLHQYAPGRVIDWGLSNNGTLPADMTTDGVHLRRKAYAKLRHLLKSAA